MFFKEIIHGTQYYRSPTPLPEEWEGDIAKMGEFHIDTLQIRINWRQNETCQGKYDFSDVDKVLALAEKYGKKVIMKLQLECAPQYVFDKLGGTRIGPQGEQIRGGYHGAFYGGWRPCFTNPKVQRAARKFVEKVAQRYAGRKSIVFWNAWNEIRNRPMEDCFCPHCRTAFGEYLKKKFGSIQKMNAFYGATEESFATVNLPSMAHGYWDIYEFKKFKGSADLFGWLRFVYEGIRKYDKVRPIMSHVGFTGAFQYTLNDVCDDYGVSKAVDFWGTSVPCDSLMDTHERRVDYFMLQDFLRSVDENYFVYEIYPGLGMFRPEWYDAPFDMRFKQYGALASGAKGTLYWQYRSERLGNENDCAGLMRMDGTARPVAFEVKKYGENLQKDMEYFVGAKAKKADVAIVFDFNSMLMSEIEDKTGKDCSFEDGDTKCYYRFAHAGMYRMFCNGGYSADYISVTQPEKFQDYKVLYFPYYTMLDSAIVPYLQKFVEKGGVLLADEGFGMRQLNTWMQPYDIDCKPLLSARLTERRMTREEYVEIDGEKVSVSPYKSEYNAKEAQTIWSFADGTPALQKIAYGRGLVYLFGFSIGYSYHATGANALLAFVKSVLDGCGVSPYAYADVFNGVYERRLQKDDKEIVFLFNASNQAKNLRVAENIEKLVGGERIENGISVPAQEIAYFITQTNGIENR
ncbi:MAG: beta-galactosidase [Clostridia bacterium]|nr:beta-galactosidase [Clostridia bacterium]